MTVRFGFGGGPTTVNKKALTALYFIMTHQFVSFDMFAV